MWQIVDRSMERICSFVMHHLTHGISSLFHSLNLILFTLLLIHLILHTSCHHSLCLYSHHHPSVTTRSLIPCL